jgi:D-aspartate ligase
MEIQVRSIMPNVPDLATTHPVLILKASRDVIHHGTVGVARTLGRLGVPVYAVVEDGYTPLATSRYLTKAFVWQSWPLDDHTFLKALSSIAGTINRPTILMPMDDFSAVCVAENASALRQWFLLPDLPSTLPRQLANKVSFHSLCVSTGIPCARTIVPRTAADVREFIKDTPFPIVVKTVEQWNLLNKRYNVIMMPTRDALLEFYEGTKPEQRSEMVLQEYIPGEDWIYHGYSNAKIDLFLGFTGKKLLSYPPGSGSTASAVSLHNETLKRQSEAFLKGVSYSGIVDIDWRLDERDGQYKLFDCNPRVGMNFRMFENTAVIDVVRAQHLDLTNRRVDCAQMIEGRLFTVESFSLLAYLRGGRRSTFPSEATLAVSRELAWWASDDPSPFFVMSVRLPLRTLRRTIRWWGSHATKKKKPVSN